MRNTNSLNGGSTATHFGTLWLVILIVGMVATLPEVLGPFCAAAIPAGAAVAWTVGMTRERCRLRSLFQIPPAADEIALETSRLNRAKLGHKSVCWPCGLAERFREAPPPIDIAAITIAPKPEPFDPRLHKFHLRWDTRVGTYANPTRSRDQNKAFRARVPRVHSLR